MNANPTELTPDVVYLTGLAHSGSTFLSRILNQHEKIFAAGELANINKYANQDKTKCSCQRLPGKDPFEKTCKFWDDVFKKLNKNSVNMGHVGRLTNRNNVEWINALFEFSGLTNQEEFACDNIKLYNILSEQTDSSVILDSSKTPWRLLPLAEHLGKDLKILHLVKSPCHQLESRIKRGYNFWHSAILKYLRKNLLIQTMFGNNENYRMIKFEDFVNNPMKTLRNLYRWIEVDDEPLLDKPQVQTHHLAGHLSAFRGPNEKNLKSMEPNPNRLEKDFTFSHLQSYLLSVLNMTCYQGKSTL